MQITEKNINDLTPYKNNAKKHDNDQIQNVANSIERFGFVQPLVIDRNGEIVIGHCRYAAAKKLNLKTVPCVIADTLTEQELKALRLIDNKTNESEWDIGLLDAELGEIFDLNMQDFGFDLNFDDEEKESEADYFGAEREKTFEAYNLYDVDLERITPRWGMPILKACDYIPKDLISFNYAKTSEEYHKGIHFYIDDYQFERVWNAPHDYMDILRRFDCVLTPDFSLYTEMPLPMQIWNVYRSKLIGQIMQDQGMKVIPTLQWCREDSYDFAFDGIEQGGTVSVSTIGVKKDDEAKKLWTDGMTAAIKYLKPKNIIIYGGDIGYDFGKINTVYINNHNSERFRNAD